MAAPIFTTGPGMVTPNVVGSTYQNLTPEAERRMYELEDERKAKREAANAAIMAQRNAEQQAKQDAESRGQVQAAFNKMYGPQLQGLYHDTMVQREGVSGPMGIPSRAPAGFTGSPFMSGVPFGEDPSKAGWRGGVAPYKMPQAQVDQMLANMWTQATDPYMQAAGQLGSQVMPQPPRANMYPSAKSTREKSNPGGHIYER